MTDAKWDALREQLFWDAFWMLAPWSVAVGVATFLLVWLGLRRS